MRNSKSEMAKKILPLWKYFLKSDEERYAIEISLSK